MVTPAHTRFLMAGYHGAILLAHAQGDRDLIEAEAVSLKRWLRHARRDADNGSSPRLRGTLRRRQAG